MLKHLKKFEGSELQEPLVSPQLLFVLFFQLFVLWSGAPAVWSTAFTQKKKKSSIFGRQCNESSQIKSSIFTAGEGHREGTSLLWMPGGLSWTQSAGSVVWMRWRSIISHAAWKKSPRSLLWMIWLVEIVVTSQGNFLWTAHSLKCKRFIATGGAWLIQSVHQTEISQKLLDGLSWIFFRDPLIPDDGAKWHTGDPLTVPVVSIL